MFHTEFRSEPIGPKISLPAARQVSSEQNLSVSDQTGIDSLLLEFRLNGGFSAQARDTLKSLASEGQTLVVRHGDNCWGVDQNTLLDQTLADHRPLCRPGSIFTAKLDSETTGGAPARLHLTGVADIADQPLMIGLVQSGPEAADTDGPERLSRIATKFQTAHTAAEEAYESLQPYLESDSPCLIVNRASGRLLAVNRPLSEILRRPTEELVGQEYTSLTGDLLQASNGRSLTLKNLTCGEFRIGLVHLLTEIEEDRSAEPAPTVTEMIIPAMQDRVAAIMLAASHQATLVESGRIAELRELSDLIVEETADLDRALVRLRLLLPGKPDRPVTVRIEEAASAACKAVKQRLATEVNAIELAEASLPAVESEPRALEMVIESVLLAHLMPDPNGRATRIAANAETGLSIISELDPDRPSGIHPDWQADAEQLADRNDQIRIDRNDTDHQLVTNISIK